MTHRVLVVEDDPDIGRLVTLQLAELDCESRLIADGVSGLAEGQWLRALADEATLADATRRALDVDPAFDLMAALGRHLGLGLFTETST